MHGLSSRSSFFAGLFSALLSVAAVSVATADEAGVSFWLPGQYGSYAAVPGKPGLSFEATFYHATASAGAGASFERGGHIEVGVKSPSDFVMLTPTYSFESKVLGGQPALGMTALVGRNVTSVSATLTGPGGGTLSGTNSDQVFGFGDLYPTATLKWNRDVHNFMIYATAAVPVGAYDPTRLAALGVGHWAADAGTGYTYLNEKAGIEFSAVFGLTYNFTNPTPSIGVAPMPIWTGLFHLTCPTSCILARSAISTISSAATAVPVPHLVNSNRAWRRSARRSDFFFLSAIVKDT